MPTQLYRVRTGSTATTSGRELLDTMEQLADAFARLTRIRAAMIQQKDGTTDTDGDFVTLVDRLWLHRCLRYGVALGGAGGIC